MKFSTLNNKQQEILEIVMAHLNVDGEAPSLRDIQKKSQTVSSMRGIALQLDALEEAGFIKRDPVSRSITLVESLSSPKDEFIEIPLLLGRVPAGIPSEFEDYIDRYIPIRLSATKGLRNVFAIKIVGDSMVDAGIVEDDHAIVSPSIVANDGDVVLALVGNGLTLKRFRVVEGHPILFPANKKYKPIADDFEVRGKLVNIVKPEMVEIFEQMKSLSLNSFL
jgi:repressor LexA